MSHAGILFFHIPPLFSLPSVFHLVEKYAFPNPIELQKYTLYLS